jgi:hypothetical protein
MRGGAKLAAACAAHAGLGPASLVLYDVSALFSKERRLEPQITIGLLTDQAGFPLTVHAFEGNMAETKTMLLVIKSFMTAHQLPDVTVVANAGMISEANQKAIEAARLSFILGMRIPHVPYVVKQWRREHPGEDIPTGTSLPSPGRPGRTAAGATRSSTASTATTGPGVPCAGSTSRSPRRRRLSPGRCRSNATGSSS